MHVLNVNHSLNLEAGGGTAERTFQMSRFLASNIDVECTALVLDIGLEQSRINSALPAKVVALSCLYKRFYVPLGGLKNIRELVRKSDIIHLMGHWSMLNMLVYFSCRTLNKPYVVCPAGALGLFGRSVYLKRIYNFFVGKAIIRNASAWIAVTQGEFPQFEDYGIASTQITVIPNGVCEDDFAQTNINSFRKNKGLSDVPIVLFMGRLNKIKGPDLLLKAFIQVHHKISEYHLVFAGPDEGMLGELNEIIRQNKLENNIHFIGYVGGEDKSAAYHSANLLVVPSRHEAMSIVALEAGICGVPVMLTDQCGFSNISEIDSRLEVPATVDGIAFGLIRLLQDSTVLNDLAPVWKNYVDNQYSWNAIIPKYIALYQDIISIQR